MSKFFLGLFMGLFLFSGFLFSNSAQAASFVCNSPKHEIDIYGDYVTSNADLPAFLSMIKSCDGVKAVRLINSNGGLISEAFPMGFYIHEKGWDTIAEGYCHSACGYIWMAGKHRYLVKDTKMLEHLPNSNNLVDISSIGDVYYYMGSIGINEAVAAAICSAANYFDNTPFDFVKFINTRFADASSFYTVITEDTDIYDTKSTIPKKLTPKSIASK